MILETVNFYCVLGPWVANESKLSRNFPKDKRDSIFHFRSAIANAPAPALEFSQFIQRMAEYKVQFEVFEGPLDLLLYLIKKEEVDIYEVNLTRLATQFIEYIDLMRQFDLEIAGEFLVMASTLMYIKSRELLPVDQQVQVEGEEEGEDPRWELIRQLVEYKKFKDAAARLQVLEAEQENIFPRLPGKLEFENAAPPPKPDVSIFDLLNAVNGVLQRFTKREDPGATFSRTNGPSAKKSSSSSA